MYIFSFLRNFFASLWNSKVKEDAVKEEDTPLDTSSKEIVYFRVSIPNTPMTKKDICAYDNRRKRLERRYIRRERHRLRWAIIRHFVEYNNLCNVDNIYDFKRSWDHYTHCQKVLSEYQPTTEDFEVSYHLIKIKQQRGECNNLNQNLPKLSNQLIQKILNIDKAYALNEMYNRMKSYWDEVLGAYNNTNVRNRRDEYLINRLTNEKQMPLIADCPQIIYKIDKLIEHFSNF